MKLHLFVFYFFFGFTVCFSQTDSLDVEKMVIPSKINVGLILPFKAGTSSWQLSKSIDNPDPQVLVKNRILEDAKISIEFFEGLLIKFNHNTKGIEVVLNVYDTYDSDSITELITREDSFNLSENQIIIGPVNSSQSKIVSEFCKKKGIYNIQPFSPSKTLGVDNSYLIKLNPSLDAICENVFESIVDSFPNSHVIVYSSRKNLELDAALHLDSLLRTSELAKKSRLSHSLCLYGGEKTDPKCSIGSVTHSSKRNIIVSTSLNVAYVQSFVKGISGGSSILFGMPNWLYSEVLRLDYINNADTRIPDYFFKDTADIRYSDFESSFVNENNSPVSRFSILGRDVADFILTTVSEKGLNFGEVNSVTTFDGIGYDFKIAAVYKKGILQYFENRYCPIFKIQDYSFLKFH